MLFEKQRPGDATGMLCQDDRYVASRLVRRDARSCSSPFVSGRVLKLV